MEILRRRHCTGIPKEWGDKNAPERPGRDSYKRKPLKVERPGVK
jgi:hypothetical protein